MSAYATASRWTSEDRIFSETYFEARSKIKAAAEAQHVLVDSLPIAAKGFNGEDLSVDIVWMGPKDATNILIHISGTHGVEGFAGSAIQLNLLLNPVDLPRNTSIILIHGLNPYGMAHLRRVSENNIDLNRNFSEERITSPTYAKIDDLMNPKHYLPVDFFGLRLGVNAIFGEGWSNIKQALACGQYDFPEGMFYGGRELEESPRVLLDWFERNFTGKPSEVKITILDVHSGLGEFGVDTLLTLEPANDRMISIFGDKIARHHQGDTVGYQPTGMLIEALRNTICRVTNCALDKITAIGQEFGTVSAYKVLTALRDENTLHHIEKRAGRVLDPAHPVRQELLRVFYPKEREWKVKVLERGRELILQSMQLFVD